MLPIKKWTKNNSEYIVSLSPFRETVFGLVSRVAGDHFVRIIPSIETDAVEDCSLGNSKTSSMFQANGILYTSSLDGIVAVWDFSKSPRPLQTYACQSPLSCVVTGLNSTLLVAGTEEGFDSKILFFDIRNNGKPLAVFDESHSDSITALSFSAEGSKLLSGSMDGLVCQFDVSLPSEATALQGVLNANSAVDKLGFFGANEEGTYVTTRSETIALFDGDSQCIISHDNDLVKGTGARQTLSSVCGQEVNYIVDCLWERKTQKLLIIAGQGEGFGFGFEATINGFNYLGPLSKGHTDQIRCAAILDSSTNFYLLTGGEDSTICLFATPSG